MPTKKNDKKLVASKQNHEMQYICKSWKDANGKSLPVKVLKDVVSKIGKSRRRIYAVLRYLGYNFVGVKK